MLSRREKPSRIGQGDHRPGQEVGQVDGEIECRGRLGGLLRYYYRQAA
ncbi:MAG: hypothetical protein MK364_06265 [Pirellulales bacterium]|nr:hypothetical protein [Pirellulales bacterium]